MRNLIFIFVLFFSCTAQQKTPTEQQVMDSWLNDTKVNLIQSWGAPQRVSPDGQGGEILTYETVKDFGQSATMATYNNVTYFSGNNNVVTRSRSFYVNKDGVIYYWLCKGRRGY